MNSTTFDSYFSNISNYHSHSAKFSFNPHQPAELNHDLTKQYYKLSTASSISSGSSSLSLGSRNDGNEDYNGYEYDNDNDNDNNDHNNDHNDDNDNNELLIDSDAELALLPQNLWNDAINEFEFQTKPGANCADCGISPVTPMAPMAPIAPTTQQYYGKNDTSAQTHKHQQQLTEDNLFRLNRKYSTESNHSSASAPQPQPQPPTTNADLYKTELCTTFVNTGVCPYGTKCQFAHGEHELKSIDRGSKWRSKPCANWKKTGTCRYGNRCCFKHGP